MNITAFINEWNNKYAPEVVPANGHQCVDLVKEWEKENGWILTWGNAIDYAKGEQGYTFTENNPNDLNQFPPVGSICVFQVGEYGHVAIAAPGTTGRVLVTFEQNDPLGSTAHIHNYNYISPKCLGWLTKD